MHRKKQKEFFLFIIRDEEDARDVKSLQVNWPIIQVADPRNDEFEEAEVRICGDGIRRSCVLPVEVLVACLVVDLVEGLVIIWSV